MSQNDLSISKFELLKSAGWHLHFDELTQYLGDSKLWQARWIAAHSGTGRVLEQWLSSYDKEDCTDQNALADDLVERLIKEGVKL